MLAFTHVIDFFAHELTGLGARRFALGFVFRSASFRSFFRHVRSSLVLAVWCTSVQGACQDAAYYSKGINNTLPMPPSSASAWAAGASARGNRLAIGIASDPETTAAASRPRCSPSG